MTYGDIVAADENLGLSKCGPPHAERQVNGDQLLDGNGNITPLSRESALNPFPPPKMAANPNPQASEKKRQSVSVDHETLLMILEPLKCARNTFHMSRSFRASVFRLM